MPPLSPVSHLSKTNGSFSGPSIKRALSSHRLESLRRHEYNQDLFEPNSKIKNPIQKILEHYPETGLRTEGHGYRTGLAKKIGSKLQIAWGDVKSVFDVLIARELEDFKPANPTISTSSQALTSSSSDTASNIPLMTLARKREATELPERTRFRNKRQFLPDPAASSSSNTIRVAPAPQERGRTREKNHNPLAWSKRDELSPDSKKLSELSKELGLKVNFTTALIEEKKTGKEQLKNLALFYKNSMKTQSDLKISELKQRSQLHYEKLNRYGFLRLQKGEPVERKQYRPRENQEAKNLADYLLPGSKERSNE